ncbi:4-hydroxy-tetrahydrodipicolinate reductase [bacterium]|nr:4-hydroxy-tetrahydrodipicolinate reductase [bacterium]
MSSLKLCVAGATGHVGSGLVKAILASGDLILTGAVSRTHAGKTIDGTNIRISGTVAEALKVPADVLIDYTKADAVKNHVLTAIRSRTAVVIGTSGLTDDDYNEIHDAAMANNVGVLAAGNFAITAVLMMRFAEMAAKYVPYWEILDYSYEGKPDAPSGTSRELAYQLSKIKSPETGYPIEKTIGALESRGATINRSQIHSVRLPGFVSSCEVIFGTTGEKLSLRHDSIDPVSPYVAGTLLAARKVKTFTGLRRGLDSIME